MTGEPQERRKPSALDVRVIVGSGLFWAWFDALFMSAFFSKAPGVLAETAVMAMDAASALALVASIALVRRVPNARIGSRWLVAAGVAGSVGSALFAFAGLAGTPGAPGLITTGGLLTGIFACVAQLGWGAPYCERGAVSALVRVSGAFAFAVLADIPLLFMSPVARSAFYALMPLASCLVLASLDVRERTYSRPAESVRTFPGEEQTRQEVPGSARAHAVRNLWRSTFVAHLGVSPAVLLSLTLVMVGFGYIQHLVSFATPSGPLDWGAVIQLARGLAASIVFAVSLARPRAVRAIYRAGFLLMIGGFMANAFFLGTDELWVSGTIIICGYTVFDVLLWVVAAQAAFAQSREPAGTVALVRALAAACYVLGAGIGLALAGPEGASPWAV